MTNRSTAPLLLREGDWEKLQRPVGSRTVRAGLAQRARMVVLTADGVSSAETAEKAGAIRTTVIAWRAHSSEAGIEDLADLDRSGRPLWIDHRAIVIATLRLPPKKLGVTHWSSRLLASRLGRVPGPVLWSPFEGAFLCIELWRGLPALDGWAGGEHDRPDLDHLPPGEIRHYSYRMSIETS